MPFRQIPVKELVNRLRKTPGIKRAELEESGLAQFFEDAVKSGVKKISKDELLLAMSRSGPQVFEDTKTQDLSEEDWEKIDEAAYQEFQDDIDRGEVDFTNELLSDFAAMARNAWNIEGHPVWEVMPLPSARAYYEAAGNDWVEAYRQYEDDVDDVDVSQVEGLFDLDEMKSEKWDHASGSYQEYATDRLRELGKIGTKYESYTLPGGYGDYAEILIKAKGLDPYQTGHWDDEDVIAHVRVTERSTSLGRTLLIEEIQSDWHQAGREEGYEAHLHPGERTRLEEKADQLHADHAEKQEYFYATLQGIPKAWALTEQLDVRGVITTAALNNWTAFDIDLTSEQRSKLKKIGADLTLLEEEMQAVDDRLEEGGGIPDAPFKGAANWALLCFKFALRHAVSASCDAIAWTTDKIQEDRWGGTEFGFYDKILTGVVKKYLRKIDKNAKIREVRLRPQGPPIVIPAVKITPKIEEYVRRGQPLYNPRRQP